VRIYRSKMTDDKKITELHQKEPRRRNTVPGKTYSPDIRNELYIRTQDQEVTSDRHSSSSLTPERALLRRAGLEGGKSGCVAEANGEPTRAGFPVESPVARTFRGLAGALERAFWRLGAEGGQLATWRLAWVIGD
jgi:hypothetical protein